MGDKHLYDKDGNYIGRVSDQSPSPPSGSPLDGCGGCFLMSLGWLVLTIVITVLGLRRGVLSEGADMRQLGFAIFLVVITGLPILIQCARKK